MEFRIAADELKKALLRAQGIVERKAAMPILSNVLVTATKNQVTVVASDLDISVVSEHPAEVSKTGSVTLSAKTLLDIVSLVPDAQVSLKKLPNNFVELSSGAAHYKIVGMAPEEFPKVHKDDNAHFVKIDGKALLEMVKKTSFAMSTDETRYFLNGVFFEAKDAGKVRMVATDGHRLALCEREIKGDFKLKTGVIVPRKGLLELKRLLEEAPDAECELAFADPYALFKKKGLSLGMRLIDGQFPEYQRVIPKEGERQILVSRARLTEALKRISLLSADKANGVKLSLSENLLRINANNPDLGEAKDDLEVAYRGGSLTVGFNARYLLDVLGATETDEVTIELGDEHSPGVLHSPGDRSYTAVVMPMRL